MYIVKLCFIEKMGPIPPVYFPRNKIVPSTQMGLRVSLRTKAEILEKLPEGIEPNQYVNVQICDMALDMDKESFLKSLAQRTDQNIYQYDYYLELEGDKDRVTSALDMFEINYEVAQNGYFEFVATDDYPNKNEIIECFKMCLDTILKCENEPYSDSSESENESLAEKSSEEELLAPKKSADTFIEPAKLELVGFFSKQPAAQDQRPVTKPNQP